MEINNYKIVSKNFHNFLKQKIPNEIISYLCLFLEEPFENYGKVYYDKLIKDLKINYMIPIKLIICYRCKLDENRCRCYQGVEILEPQFNFDMESVIIFNDYIIKQTDYNSEQISYLIRNWKYNEINKKSCFNLLKKIICGI